MVFKLRFNRSDFLVFDVSPEELEDQFGEDHFFLLDEPIWASFWKPINAQFHDDSDGQNVAALPDITCWFTDQLVLNKQAYQKLGSTLEPYGEFLPVQYERTSFKILHVTKLTGLEAINQDESDRLVEESGHIEINKISFKDDAIRDLLLFKTEYDGYKNIYCSNKFKDLIEGSKLNGLIFNADLASVF